jgi:hypothetical protein
VSDPTPEERAAAQAFARAHGNLDLGQLQDALTSAYGDGWSAGALVGAQQTGATIITGLDGVAAPADWSAYWDAWQPGNTAAATKLDQGGLSDLLEQAGRSIDGIEGTTLDRFGSILADGAANGDSVDTIAGALGQYLQDPARAFAIADTELARAVTSASLDAYLAAGVGLVDWLVSPGACPICDDYGTNGPYPIADFPGLPAHPRCRCSSAPVDPGIDAARLQSPALNFNLPATAGMEDAAADLGPISGRDLTGLTDDDLGGLFGQSVTDEDAQAIADELDRRDAVERQATNDAAKKAAVKVKRAAKTQSAIDAKDAAFDAALNAGQDAESAYADIYGVSVEQQARDRATSMLRDQGFTGTSFDKLSSAAFKDELERSYFAAEDATNGAMLNKAAQQAGIDTRKLFNGTEAFARKWASDELLEYWEANGRVTLEDYRSGLLGGHGKSVGYWTR